jgi:hypothetical protein
VVAACCLFRPLTRQRLTSVAEPDQLGLVHSAHAHHALALRVRAVRARSPCPCPCPCPTRCRTVSRAQVRPYLVADGGDVEVVDVDNGYIFLRLQGSCSTCASSAVGGISDDV